MALPVGVVQLGTFKGDKGDTGTIAYATAESIPAGEEATVDMVGADDYRGAHFRIPRGLPGVNAVANDAAMAALVGAVDSDTRIAMNGLYAVYRVWDGSTYPARATGASNLFIGPIDPGLAMDPAVDVWANPDWATMDSVTAAMSDSGSALYAATLGAVNSRNVVLAVNPGATSVSLTSFGTPPSDVLAWSVPKGGTNSVRAVGQVPKGWNTAGLRVRWIQAVGAAADARLNVRVSLIKNGAVTKYSNETVSNRTSAAALIPKTETYFTFPVEEGDYFSTSIFRLSDSSGDTVAGPIGIMDVWLERLS